MIGTSDGPSPVPASTRGLGDDDVQPVVEFTAAATAPITVTASTSGTTTRFCFTSRSYHAAARVNGSTPSRARSSTSGVAQWSSHGNVASFSARAPARYARATLLGSARV